MSSQAETLYFWHHLHNMFPARMPAAGAGAEGGTAQSGSMSRLQQTEPTTEKSHTVTTRKGAAHTT
jgi:hypothetical protein